MPGTCLPVFENIIFHICEYFPLYTHHYSGQRTVSLSYVCDSSNLKKKTDIMFMQLFKYDINHNHQGFNNEIVGG